MTLANQLLFQITLEKYFVKLRIEHGSEYSFPKCHRQKFRESIKLMVDVLILIETACNNFTKIFRENV